MPGISVITMTAGPDPATWTRLLASFKLMSRATKSSSGSSTFMLRAGMSYCFREMLQVFVAGNGGHLRQTPDAAVGAPGAVGDIVDDAGGRHSACFIGEGGGDGPVH